MAKMAWEAAKREMHACVICGWKIDWQYTSEGEAFWKDGHNARPVKAGRCCTLCNEKVVIPARIQDMIENQMTAHDEGRYLEVD